MNSIKMERVTILVRGPFSEYNWYRIPRYLFTQEEYMLLPQLSGKAYHCRYDSEWNYWVRSYDIVGETIDQSMCLDTEALIPPPLETRLIASFFLNDTWESYRVPHASSPYAVLTEYTALRRRI